MRPHVELIHEDDYVWHAAELPGGEGRASERRLSVDEEDGSSSLRVDFHTDWGRGPGIHHANTEYYVLDGRLTYGEQVIGQGGYLYLPKGVPTDAVRFAEGTSVLHYREYGDAGFDAVDSVGWADSPRWTGAHEDVIVLDTDAMTFDAVPNAGPMPGLFIKYLHVDPSTGFYTRLVFAQEGWADHRLAHHPCYEEAYTVQGHMEYNFGTLDLGTYFFRPARVKHGHFTTMEGGATWLLRSDGELVNWYTQNEYVRWGGEAVNWGPEGSRMTTSQSTSDLAGGRTWRSDARPRGPAALRPVPVGQRRRRRAVRPARARPRPQPHRDRQGPRRGPPAGRPHRRRPRPRPRARPRPRPRPRHARTPRATTARRPRRADDELGWADPSTLEHADERTDAHAHNWGAGRPWKAGDPVPAPILSSLPVRSRSRGRWDADGM